MTSPLIIIGAGRSGTNALRNALCSLESFHTWPCDEINYIWRHGNRQVMSDQFTAEHARPEVIQFIREAMQRRASVQPSATLVEKTCANSLRVEFVDRVVPDARYIHIVRDGRDVVASAVERWTAPLDVRYLAQKARFVPPSDLPFYASRYLANRVSKQRSDQGRLAWWGPRFDGWEALREDTPLVEVAARQWERSVSLATDQLAALPADRTATISYRDFVTSPRETLAEICGWAGAIASDDELDSSASGISDRSLGRWRSRLQDDELEAIEPIIEPVHRRVDLEL